MTTLMHTIISLILFIIQLITFILALPLLLVPSYRNKIKDEVDRQNNREHRNK